jgi:hypothetical protein
VIDYLKIDEKSFELCTTFETRQTEQDMKTTMGGFLPGYHHPAGHACYVYDAVAEGNPGAVRPSTVHR